MPLFECAVCSGGCTCFTGDTLPNICVRGYSPEWQEAEPYEPQPSAHYNISGGCEQCENYDLVKKRLSVECYTCKRYYGDLFLRRK